jgi:predicted metalloprotease
MRWKSGRRSTNIEDRRGMRVTRKAGIGGGAGLILLLLYLFLGGDPGQMMDMIGGGAQSSAPLPPNTAQQDEAAEFISVVLADTEDTWAALFQGAGKRYHPPKLVLFSEAVQSACGFTGSATGPFYCPGDNKVYLDLTFFNEMKRMGAPGDFAAAYVVAHEVGHHVQNLLGISGKVRQLQMQTGQKQANALSVMLELQADCFAGVWAHHAERQRHILEEGDVEEGLRAAAAVGDDRIMRSAGRYVNPDSFTHGSSEQRVAWFSRGFKTGDVGTCDTFSQSRR